MHRVGFEPTKLSLSELESDPLDRSGIYALYTIYTILFKYIKIYIYML